MSQDGLPSGGGARLVITGGGTGGHIFAGVAIAREFLSQSETHRVLFIGSNIGLETRLIPKAGFDLVTLRLGKLAGQSLISKFITMLQIPFAIVKSMLVLTRFKTDMVIGVGGYAAGPCIIAARILGIKTGVLEQNAVMGFTNRISAKIASYIFTAFNEVPAGIPRHKCTFTGNPTRSDLKSVENKTPFVIFVFGGSQGANGINRMMTQAAADFLSLKDKISIVHQTGPKDFQWVCECYQKAGLKVEVHQFIDNMQENYNKASLVICRAGSGTIAELGATKNAAILIPFPQAAGNHQVHNAQAVENAGAGIMLLQSKNGVDTKGSELFSLVVQLMNDEAELLQMREKIAPFHKPDAAKKIIATMKGSFHFIGIGGIGMSGIAEVLARLGFSISGSDLSDSDTVKRLRSGLGLKISVGHRVENIENAKVVVVSSAIKSDNPELIEARKKGLPVVQRAEMLAELMRLKYGIAIAGSHGKTTTTSMLGHILAHAGTDPTVIVGGVVNSFGSNAKLGSGKFLVAETDESDGSFLKLSPVISVITNIDNDHLDFYKEMTGLRRAFVEFANKVPCHGRVVACIDDPETLKILPLITRPVLTYGFSKNADYQIADYAQSGLDGSYAIHRQGQELCKIKLLVPGEHNARNSVAALIAALELNIGLQKIQAALSVFTGVQRRFELKGEKNGITLVDDYGHHPTEIKAALETARKFWSGRIVTAFQPHRFTRTQACWNQFATAFELSDEIYLLDIYAAGEAPINGIDSTTLAATIRNSAGKQAIPCGNIERTLSLLQVDLRRGDLLITLGAGNITGLGSKLFSIL